MFGVVFRIDLLDDAAALSYIVHRGDTKDPGADQSLVFDTFGHEAWQLQAADPDDPYVAPLREAALRRVPNGQRSSSSQRQTSSSTPPSGSAVAAVQVETTANEHSGGGVRGGERVGDDTGGSAVTGPVDQRSCRHGGQASALTGGAMA